MSEIMTKVGNPRCFQGFLRPGRAGPGRDGGQQLLVDHDAKLVLILMLKLGLTSLPMLLILAEIFAALFCIRPGGGGRTMIPWQRLARRKR